MTDIAKLEVQELQPQQRYTSAVSRQKRARTRVSLHEIVIGICLLFLFLYVPRHQSWSFLLPMIPVAVGFWVLFRHSSIALRLFATTPALRVALLLFLGCISGVVSTVVMAGNDSYLPLLMLKALGVYFPVSIGLVIYTCRRRRAVSCLDTAVKVVLLATVVQAFAIIAQFLSPAFNMWTSRTFAVTLHAIVGQELHSYKFPGISHAGGAGLSLMQGFGVFLAGYCMVTAKRQRERIAYILLAVLLLFSTTLVGRTGTVVGCVAIGVLLLAAKRLRVVSFVAFSLVTLLVIVASRTHPSIKARSEHYGDVVVRYAFEPLFNYTQTGSLATGSTDDLRSMLYVPKVEHVLLGVGSFDVPGYRLKQTDSGYLKTALASGIPGVLSVYGGIVCMFATILGVTRGRARLVLMVGFLMLLVAEIKEPFLYQNTVARCLWVLFAAALLDHRNQMWHSRPRETSTRKIGTSINAPTGVKALVQETSKPGSMKALRAATSIRAASGC